MRYIIYGKNLEVTEGLKQAVHDKFSKLEKFFTPETEVQVTLSVQKDNQIVEATIPMKGTILRVEPNSTDMYVSIDMAVDLLERMIRKYKTKISKYGKGELKFNDEFMEEDVDNQICYFCPKTEDRLHLSIKNGQVHFILHSVCTIFARNS